MIEGFETYALSAWLDKCMTIQVATPARSSRPEKSNGAIRWVNRVVSGSVLAAGVALSNFAWAIDMPAPVSANYAAAAIPLQRADIVSAEYLRGLIARLKAAPQIPDDANLTDSDAFF